MCIAENLECVRERICSAAERARTDFHSIALVAVTKTVDAARIEEAIQAGVTDIGENYVQDSIEKFGTIGRRVRWHMIGHLQRNKAKRAVEVFDLIQSVDSLPLAQEIAKRAAALGKVQDVLVEVDISGETSKFGVAPEEALALVDEADKTPGVKVLGLMGIAPFVEGTVGIRESFILLRELWEGLPAECRRWLSMGMTSDFEIAIEEGSNMVRVGRAIFGARG